MKSSWIRNIFGTRSVADRQSDVKLNARERLEYDIMPPLVYAVGDVHGCLNLLLKLEELIAADCVDQAQPALVIMLGDYVDRGPDSCAVIDHLIAPPAFNAQRLCLTGNHEEGMLAFLTDPKPNANWLEFGGRETLLSYGLSDEDIRPSSIRRRSFIYKINSFVPNEHIDFLRKLPIMAKFPAHVFVHAGLRPHLSLEQQSDRDFLWIRDEFLKHSEGFGFTIIHGHTPVEKPFISGSRINVDTGAYMSDHLAAAKFVDGEFAGVISTQYNRP